MRHVFEKAHIISEQAGCFSITLGVMSNFDDATFACRQNWFQPLGFRLFEQSVTHVYDDVVIHAFLNKTGLKHPK